MRPIKELSNSILVNIDAVLVDIDGTLTCHGRVPAVAYAALEKLQSVGLKVVPITGRPAGWCDHIARMWPVDGIVGENGAFYFHYDTEQHRMIRHYQESAALRRKNRDRLLVLADEILAAVPGTAIAADQAYRETDLAIDFCEDVSPLPMDQVSRIAERFAGAGARAKISSIHVNGWFGEYDKLTMTKVLFREVFHLELDNTREQVIFVGDSPNDEPMFAYFPHAVGVANIMRFADQLSNRPAWITGQKGGFGFAELAEAVAEAKARASFGPVNE